MKGGLCIIYTSLLTISILSSCALFILVVSEALQAEGDKVDLSGLSNVSQKVSSMEEDAIPDPLHSDTKYDTDVKEKQGLEEQEMIIAETLSVNSVTTDGLPDSGHPPILISLAENIKLDLKTADELLFVNDSDEHNDTKRFIVGEKDAAESEKQKHEEITTEKESTEPVLIVKAKPMHETRQTEEAFRSTTPLPEIEKESQPEDRNEENIPVKHETPQEDIPSFSEWAQKQLAEAEKKDTVLNHSSQPSHSNTNFSNKSTKLRSKNYASLACGAKVVAVNPEAGSASSILSPNRDEYMLNRCNSRIWFVVELCEAVQAQKIEIANFELFSSTPKDIAVYFSDRFPTREWASVGQFTAQDMRDIQSFDLYPHLFGKFIKVEMLSHHGSEHYCPISLFKVYGTSEFEVLEKESSQHTAHIDEDEDDDIIDVPDVPAAETEPSKNLFGSARDAVMSIMKKAAQALVKTEVPKNVSNENNDTSVDEMYKRCCSPSHIIVCDNCSETLYNEVYELLSCSSDKLTSLVRQVFLRETLKCTEICRPYGLDFKSTKTIEFSDERVAYMNALFPPKYLAALCNILAIKEKKVVLNTSFETEQNITKNITIDETPQKINSETNSEQEVKLVPIKNGDTEEKINETQLKDPSLLPEEMNENSVTLDLTKEEKDEVDVKKEEQQSTAEEITILEPQEDLIPDSDKVPEPEIDNDVKDSKTDAKNGKSESVNDKSKENVIVDDMNDQMIIIESDNLISDLDQMAVDPAPAGSQSNLNQNQAPTTLQKESVFLRLSNRVKTLERNMSLSGQYLEELSRRYKKQVEEMQKSFEKTMVQMSEERRKSNEREQKYLEQLSNLQEQLTQMASALNILMEERNSWLGNMTVLKFILFQSIIFTVAFYYLSKRRKSEQIVMVPVTKKIKKKQDRFRRKSVEGVSGHASPSIKKRRPSEEAFQIERQSTQEMERELDNGEWQIARKNRRRKTSVIHRGVECDTSINYVRQDSLRKLQENPIPLDEGEYFAPVSEPREFAEEVPVKKESPKTNGSFFNNLKSKTMKTRRLSSPAFLRTLSRQSARSTPSPVMRTLEPMFNGKLGKKAASESPTGSLWSESTELSQNGPQENEIVGKKKKSLKNILKKVF